MVAIATISPNIASPEGEGFAPSPEETEGFLPLAERILCERGRRLADQDPQPSSRRARRQRTRGETSHRQLAAEESAGRIAAVDLPAVRRRDRGPQPVERVARAPSSAPAAAMERPGVAARGGLHTAAQTPSTSAQRRFLQQCRGHVLLPLQRAARLQPCDPALGLARGDEADRRRDRSPRRPGEISACQAANQLPQRAAMQRPGLQGVHANRGDDAPENVTLLAAIERAAGAWAQVVAERMQAAGRAADAAGCTAAERTLRRA